MTWRARCASPTASISWQKGASRAAARRTSWWRARCRWRCASCKRAAWTLRLRGLGGKSKAQRARLAALLVQTARDLVEALEGEAELLQLVDDGTQGLPLALARDAQIELVRGELGELIRSVEQVDAMQLEIDERLPRQAAHQTPRQTRTEQHQAGAEDGQT